MWGLNLWAGKIHVLDLFQEGNHKTAGSRHEAAEKRTSPSNKRDQALDQALKVADSIIRKS